MIAYFTNIFAIDTFMRCIVKNNSQDYVIGGGACNSKYIACSLTRRNYANANRPCTGIGFRIALTQSVNYA